MKLNNPIAQLGALLLLLPLSWGGNLHAEEPQAPDKLVQSLFEDVNKRLQQDAELIAKDKDHLIEIGNEMLGPYVSFETMAKQILNKNWRKITPDQRTRYTDAFRQRVAVTMVSQYDSDKKYDLEVTGARFNTKGDRAAVGSVVTDVSAGKKHNISYKLFMNRQLNKWQVYDVVVEGVSVLQSFKSASAEDFKRNGIESMIAQLKGAEPDKTRVE